MNSNELTGERCLQLYIRKVVLTGVMIAVFFSSFFALYGFHGNTQLLYIPVSSSCEEDSKNTLTAYRGEYIQLVTRVYDLNGNPAADVMVTLYDEGNNKNILAVSSDESGYAVFDWIIPWNYPLGVTTIRFITNSSYTANPSSLSLKIISRTSLEAISYPTKLVQGGQYYVTVCLKDNIQNPIPNQLIYLYLDDLPVAAGRTDSSGMRSLLFLVPKHTSIGMHNLTFKYAGNETYAPASLTLKVEVVPKAEDPVITSVSLNKSIVRPGASVKVTVETNGTVDFVTINGTSMLNVSVSLWEAVIVAPQAQGSYTLQVCAIGNGKECFASINIYVDATPPRVTAYVSNPTPKPGELIKVIVEATDETEVTVVKVNGVNADRNGGFWSFSFNAPLKEGTYSFNVTAVDVADNVATASITYSVVSDKEDAGGALDGTSEHLFLILQLSYLNSGVTESGGDRLLFACTSAFCVLLIAAALRKPRDFRVLDDLSSLDNLT